MAKKKQKSQKTTDRSKVNFQNPKTKLVIASLQLGENSITKGEILEMANKDIYYKLKNSGYIKEENGRVKATSKLQDYVKKLDGSHFSYSSSQEHSKAIRNTLAFLPKDILTARAFTTGYDVEKQYKRFAKTPAHKERMDEIRHYYKERLSVLNATHQSFLKGNTDDCERYAHNIHYQRERESIMASLNRLEKDVCLTPDYQVTFSTREDLDSYITNLERYRDELSENTRAYSLYTESIDTLRGLEFENTITISIEIVTSRYSNREMELHRNYSLLTNNQAPQIFLM